MNIKIVIVIISTFLFSCTNINNSFVSYRDISDINETFLFDIVYKCYEKHIKEKSPTIDSSSLLPIKQITGPVSYITWVQSPQSVVNFEGESESFVETSPGVYSISTDPDLKNYSMMCSFDKLSGKIIYTSYSFGTEHDGWKNKEKIDLRFPQVTDEAEITIEYILDLEFFLRKIYQR